MEMKLIPLLAVVLASGPLRGAEVIGKITVIVDKAPIYRGGEVVGEAQKGQTFGVTAVHGDWYGVIPVLGWVSKEHARFEELPSRSDDGRSVTGDQFSIDQSYSGKYSQHRKFRSLVETLTQTRTKAIVTIHRRLGLRLKERDVIMLGFDDDNGRSRNSAETRTETVEGVRTQVITFFMERHVSWQIDVEKELTHELIHAIMRARMGPPYSSLPKWLREGLAVWGAEQLPERARVTVASAIFGKRDPTSLIDGLAGETHTLDDYVEDALLFEGLARRCGQESVRSLLDAVVSGEQYQPAFERITGQKWPELQNESRAFGAQYIRTMLSQGYAKYQLAIGLVDQKRYAEAVSKFRDFRRSFPQSFLVANAWYMIGKSCYRQKNYEAAIKAFKLVLDDFREDAHLQNDAQYRLAKCYTQTRQLRKAVAAYETLFRDHSASPKSLLANGHHFLGNTYMDKGDFPSAIQEYKTALMHKGDYAESSLYMLGRAYRSNGERTMARQTFERFLKDYPQSEYCAKAQQCLAMLRKGR